MYNLTLSKGHQAPPDWAFNLELSSDNVYDGFVIVSLLEDHAKCNDTLKVPHTGLQKDRLRAAMKGRNLRMQLYNQPEVHHYCKGCCRFYADSEGKGNAIRHVVRQHITHTLVYFVVTHKCWVVVIDGVTVGCCCCGVHNCQVPLSSNHDRFCADHKGRNLVCAIVGCERPVLEGRLTCADNKHQAVEHVHRERGQARFQLKERLQRARIAHPNDSDVSDVALVDEDNGEEEEFVVASGTALPAEASQVKEGRVHAQFGRKRTHNEQIIVAPCGMIIARETFYGAEAVSSVIVSTQTSSFLYYC